MSKEFAAKLETFRDHFYSSIVYINSCASSSIPELRHITNWLMTTHASPYSFFVDVTHANACFDAVSLANLLRLLKHRIIDCDTINFPVVDGRPRLSLEAIKDGCEYLGDIYEFTNAVDKLQKPINDDF